MLDVNSVIPTFGINTLYGVTYLFMASYKGKYKPTYYKKYKGDPTNIIYRSLWERKFMYYCDHNESIIEWSSEEYVIPYKSPVDGKWHRYFPDFYMKVRNLNGSTETYLVEVKPKAQVEGPKPQKTRTKKYITEVATYATNQAKWKAAEEFCRDRLWKFKIITEVELKV